ncbi:E3 ubiquitin-protein ligase RFWD3 [Sergentomyia squamirostris]
MDEDEDNQPHALSPRVLLYDIVQQGSNAPEHNVQEAPTVADNTIGGSRRRSEPRERENSPLSDDDFVLENLKKRKKKCMKLPSPTQTQNVEKKIVDEDDDEGIVCPICYEEWEMTGLHRLTSLKCGHLFGHSCIKRWLSECPSNGRVCPSCKTKATMRDMRFLYAKRLRMVDNSEVERLKTLLEESLKEKSRVHTELALLRVRYEQQLVENTRLTREIHQIRDSGTIPMASGSHEVPQESNRQYKLFLEKNLDMTRHSNCRVIQFAKRSKSLVVSQKSTQSLFPGYGVRFIDVETLKGGTFMHMTSKTIRDVAFDSTGDFLVAASVDSSVKVFDVKSKFCAGWLKCPEDNASPKMIWSCCFDSTRDQAVLVGSSNGRVSRFDMRQPTTPQDFLAPVVDVSPVINIASIAADNVLPCGGVLVCTLQNLWLHELGADGMPTSCTALPLEGPFTAMMFDNVTKWVLVTVRPSQAINRYSAQHIVGHLHREEGTIFFKTSHTFNGSTTMPIMYRSTLVNLEQDTLVAAYVHSSKMLTTYSTRDDCRVQTMSVADSILDLCSFNVDSQFYLGGLTENKCRFYKIEGSS